MITWARERAGLTVEDLQHRFKRLPEWESGDINPTLKQVQDYATATHTPVGYLFLPEPPAEPLPVADFRRLPAGQTTQPSPDLLDVLYLCQQRQEWYRDFAISYGEDPVELVGVATVDSDVVPAAGDLREATGFTIEARAELPTWTDALRSLRQQAEDVRILVMISGIVGSNTHRKLDPGEFRGFALSDPYAPLLFVNGADSKAAQIFTIAHEIGHILLGESGVSNPQPRSRGHVASERWCNSFAAEFLVPLAALNAVGRTHEDLVEEINALARRFKVSTLVALRRIHEAEWIDRDEFDAAYEAELDRVLSLDIKGGSGGDFYKTLRVHVSERFARAVVIDTLEGQTLYRDAFRMLGFRSQATFDRLTVELGVG
jgi:Zn-dependent peptidase ImmA (M78 family)